MYPICSLKHLQEVPGLGLNSRPAYFPLKFYYKFHV